MTPYPLGKAVVKRTGQRVAFLAFGPLLTQALEAATSLDATVVDMRFVKPLDIDLIKELAAAHDLLVTLEENVIQGEQTSRWCGLSCTNDFAVKYYV